MKNKFIVYYKYEIYAKDIIHAEELAKNSNVPPKELLEITVRETS